MLSVTTAGALRLVSESESHIKISADEWACAVQVRGLHEQLGDMHGIDSWQAMQLAYQLAAQLLGSFVEDGGQLFWEEGGEQLVVSELFAKVSAF